VLANRPFPKWIRLTVALVVVILAIALSQSPRTLLAGVAYERGSARETAGAYEAAVSEYRRVADAFPESTLVLARLAVSLKKAGRLPEARLILQRLGSRQAPKELVQEVNQTFDQFASERKALSQEIEQKKAAATALEARIRELDGRISTAEEQLRALKLRISEIENQAQDGMTADEQEYHRLVAQYNSIVEEHNSNLNSRNLHYAQYKVQQQEINSLVDRYNALISPKGKP
jgi:chromosome segregation ATPase